MSSSTPDGVNERRGLTVDELNEIKQLALFCNEYEGLDLKLNWGTLQTRPVDQLNDFLYYIDNQLVGFLPLFAFNLIEGEISGMVHPAFRRRGIFSTLFEAARRESLKRGLPSLLLIAEQASPGAQGFARHLATTYDHSEYKMVLEEPRLPTSFDERLQFRPAHVEDLPVFTEITAEAFHIPEADVTWYVAEVLAQANRRYYVGEIDGVVIGKIDVNLSEEAGYILGFAVRPEYQGQGYGRQILASTVQEILQRGRLNIWLEVSTENKNALALYQSCGFKETGSYDYYRLQLLGLSAIDK